MKLSAPRPPSLTLAFVGAFLFTLPAFGALVPDPVTTGVSTSDLFLGFRAGGGQGGSTSYLVKLGANSAFPTVEGASFSISGLGNIGLDLATTYGANWNTRSDLFWGVFGTTSSANPAVFGSRERGNVSQLTNPWPALDLTARNSVNTQIGTNVLNGINGYKGSTATANSPVGTLQANSGNSTSYNFQVATNGTTDFGSLSQWTSIEGDFGDGTAGTVLDLWRIGSLGVTYRGAFSIDDTGLVNYSFNTVVPAPEPATWAWGLVVVGAVALPRLRTRRVLA